MSTPLKALASLRHRVGAGRRARLNASDGSSAPSYARARTGADQTGPDNFVTKFDQQKEPGVDNFAFKSGHARAASSDVHQRRRRRLGVAGLLGGSLALSGLLFGGGAATTAGAAEDSCPNAAVRSQQNATHLPDCRAYEQVSPVDKNNSNVGVQNLSLSSNSSGPIVSAADGEVVAYSSLGAFSGSSSASLPNGYAASRSSGGWGTDPLSPPVSLFPPLTSAYVSGTTADFSKQLVVTGAALTPDAGEHTFNLYLHDRADDSYALIQTLPNKNPLNTRTSVVGASTDGSNWFFHSSEALDSTPAPGAATEGGSFYLYSDGELKLAGVRPDGGAAPNGSVPGMGPGRSPVARHAVSDDLSRAYWSDYAAFGNAVGVYLYEDDESTLITQRETDNSPQAGYFQYATPDGSRAFVTSDDQLTADASPSGFDLYRYDAQTGDLEDLTPTGSSAGVQGVLGVSDDGSYVYFQATGALAPGATAGQRNIYVWHDGAIRLIATSAAGLGSGGLVSNLDPVRISPNGQYFGLIIDGALSGPNPQPDVGAEQVYIYDYDADALTCASCPVGAGPASADASFQLEPGDFQGVLLTLQSGVSRNLLDDGRMYFNSSDPLVGGDNNGRQDVYEYDGEEVSLVSTGRSAENSYFGDATLDGGDVFFLTLQGLVGQDNDTLVDLYDARVNGGLASQNPFTKPACQGDACQDEPTTAPPADDPPSSVIDGSGNPEPPPSCGAFEKKADRKAARADRTKAKAKKAKKKARKASGKKAKRLKKKARKLTNRAYKAQKQATKAERKLSNCRSSK